MDAVQCQTIRCPYGSMVDSWVRGGTRAVPSQCSGPPVSFSAGPGFEPGTLCDSLQVSNHLATWAGHESWWKTFHLYQHSYCIIIIKKHPRLGSNCWRSTVWVLIHQTTPNTWWGLILHSNLIIQDLVTRSANSQLIDGLGYFTILMVSCCLESVMGWLHY